MRWRLAHHKQPLSHNVVLRVHRLRRPNATVWPDTNRYTIAVTEVLKPHVVIIATPIVNQQSIRCAADTVRKRVATALRYVVRILTQIQQPSHKRKMTLNILSITPKRICINIRMAISTPIDDIHTFHAALRRRTKTNRDLCRVVQLLV